MGNIKVKHEGLCKTLLILLGEVLASGRLMGPRLRSSFHPSTCHRPPCRVYTHSRWKNFSSVLCGPLKETCCAVSVLGIG